MRSDEGASAPGLSGGTGWSVERVSKGAGFCAGVGSGPFALGLRRELDDEEKSTITLKV
jgi:hypothetical protein